jgi:hypothetical protein
MSGLILNPPRPDPHLELMRSSYDAESSSKPLCHAQSDSDLRRWDGGEKDSTRSSHVQVTAISARKLKLDRVFWKFSIMIMIHP